MSHSSERIVFLLDDDHAVRKAMASLTRSLDVPLVVYGSAEDFIKQFDPAQPGCVVSEVQLPGMSGVDLLEKFHLERVFLAAVLVAQKAEVTVAVRGMRAGAVTFLEKPLTDDQLWTALAEAMAFDADFRVRQAKLDRIRHRLERLNNGELDVLKLIVSGKMNREIADSLDVSVRTVEVRRSKIMTKMKTATPPELIRDLTFLDFSCDGKLWEQCEQGVERIECKMKDKVGKRRKGKRVNRMQ